MYGRCSTPMRLTSPFGSCGERLLHGGAVVVVSQDDHSFAAGVPNFVGCNNGVTVLNQTPSAFYQLMQADAESPKVATGYRCATSCLVAKPGADATGAVVSASRGRPRRVLVNMYGITETTVHLSVTWRWIRELTRAAGASLIGGNIPDLRVYVLDGGLEPVPDWGDWRAVCGGCGPGAGLFESTWADGGALCGRPTRKGAWHADVSHGGSGALAR